MKSYVRKSKKLKSGDYLITRYSLGESIFLDIIKLGLNICILPVKILFAICKSPFKLLGLLLKRKK